jgi:hypothetical protein
MTGGETTPRLHAETDRRTVLSTVWAALLFNFVYAIFSRSSSTQQR